MIGLGRTGLTLVYLGQFNTKSILVAMHTLCISVIEQVSSEQTIREKNVLEKSLF